MVPKTFTATKKTNDDGGKQHTKTVFAPSLKLMSLIVKTFNDSSIKPVLEKCCFLRRWLAKHHLRKVHF